MEKTYKLLRFFSRHTWYGRGDPHTVRRGARSPPSIQSCRRRWLVVRQETHSGSSQEISVMMSQGSTLLLSGTIILFGKTKREHFILTSHYTDGSNESSCRFHIIAYTRGASTTNQERGRFRVRIAYYYYLHRYGFLVWIQNQERRGVLITSHNGFFSPISPPPLHHFGYEEFRERIRRMK